MNVTADDIISSFELKPHPFEGWSVELSHIPDQERVILWLITAEMFIPWHQMPAQSVWKVKDGAPCSMSITTDAEHASASVFGPGYLPSLTVPADADMTLTTIGRFSLLEVSLKPDVAITDRIDRPDHWYPRPRIGGSD